MIGISWKSHQRNDIESSPDFHHCANVIGLCKKTTSANTEDCNCFNNKLIAEIIKLVKSQLNVHTEGNFETYVFKLDFPSNLRGMLTK